MEVISGVYMIINLKNGKCYVGSSKNIKKRWRKHRWYLKSNKHKNSYLQNTWNKYGSKNFKFVILEKTEDKLNREQFFIDLYNPEYNIAKDTKVPMQGWNHTEETKEKISEAVKGKEFSEEHKKKIGKAHKGQRHTKEAKRKISENHADFSGEDHPLYGKHHSKETRRKMSENHADFSGENNPRSKLTKKKVKIIKHLLEGDHFTYKQISKMFSVHSSTISRIKSGKSWSHISI